MKKISNEVYYPSNSLVLTDKNDIDYLKEIAEKNDRKRSRLCTHLDISNKIHEMLIIHTSNTYVRPHKHVGKSESFHVIEGEMSVIIFDDSGEIKKHIKMGDYNSGKLFYYRLEEELYHMVIINSPIAVFHECTNGPFNPNDTIFAPWSPENLEDSNSKNDFIKSIENKCKQIE